MNIDYVLECFYAGVKNHKYYQDKHGIQTGRGIFYRLAYFVWVLFLVLFPPRRIVSTKKICLIYGHLHEKILSEYFDYEKVYLGLALKGFSNILNKPSMVSMYSRLERLRMLVKAIYTLVINRLPVSLVHYWVEFYFIKEFIMKTTPETITVAGHFDKYTTWISYIACMNKITFNISQHGAIERINLPNKIYCNNFHVFSESEMKFIKDCCITNSDCQFKIKGYKSHVIFEEYPDKGLNIAIASQDLYSERTIKLIRFIQDLRIQNFNVIVYPHPRENKKLYQKLKQEYNNVNIFPKKRHKNIDILITYFSTIIYDYIEVNSRIKLICFPPANLEMSFFTSEQLRLVSDFSELKETLLDEVKNHGKLAMP